MGGRVQFVGIPTLQLGRYAAMQLLGKKCFQNGATVFCVAGAQEFKNDFNTSLSSWFQSAPK